MSQTRIPIARWEEQVPMADGSVSVREVDTTVFIQQMTSLTAQKKELKGVEAFNIVGEIATSCDDIRTDEAGDYIELGSATFKWLQTAIKEETPAVMAQNPDIRKVIESILAL